MNTFKKLIFGLLLSGMAFTVACGDNTEKKPGDTCKKADDCGDLKCVIKNAGDKSGTCEKPCTDAKKDCKDAKKTKCDNGIEFGKTKAETKVCMAGTTVKPGTAELGADCDTSGAANKTCKPDAGLACYQGKCYETCTSAADEAGAASCNGKHSGADKTALAPDCKVDGDTKVCVEAAGPAPARKLGEGDEGCEANSTDEAKTCDENLTCVKVTEGTEEKQRCMVVCQTKGAASSECAASKKYSHCSDVGAKKAADDAATPICFGGGAPKTGASAGLGDACDESSTNENEKCGSGLTCHTDSKCYATCSAANAMGNTECTASGAVSGSDKSSPAPTCTASGSGFVCSA